MPKPLAIELLRLDGDTQSRVNINEDVVEDYAATISENDKRWPFPPVDVFYDETDYFVGDGFHRVHAGLRANRGSVPCIIHKGTARDARIFGMTANDQHGLRMTRADKRACVNWLLDQPGKMTQKEIAEKAGVSPRLVQVVVADRKPSVAAQPPPRSDAQSAKSPPRSDGDPLSPETAFEEAAQDDSEAIWDEGAPEPPPAGKGRKRGTQRTQGGKGKPPKQYDRSALLKTWTQGIGPLIRQVTRIAEGVGEKHGKHHKAVRFHLDKATDIMEEWMKQ